MRKTSLILFSLKQLAREWKAGQLYILSFALLIAVGSHTSIGFFTDRVEKAMELKSRDLLGGDLVIKSPEPIPNDWLKTAEHHNLQIANIQEFSSVIINEENLLLVSVKSVSENYPLKGAIRVSNELYGTEQLVTHGPQPGKVWVQARVMSSLQLELNQNLTLGSTEFVISKIIIQEPDGGNFYSFNPRVIINDIDLPKTEILQPGSRVDYQFLFAGSQDATDLFRDWLAHKLSSRQKLVDLESERPSISNVLNRAQQYMGLASLVAVLLAAVAIAMSAKHYSERHYDTSALLRCMGCQQKDILTIYFIQLTVLAIFAGVVGSLLGWSAQQVLVLVLKDLLPSEIPQPGASPVISGFAISFLVLHCLSIPSLIRLGAMSPVRVLRKDTQPIKLSAWLVYGSCLALVVLMIWFYTGNLQLTLAVILATAFVLILATILVNLIFWFFHRISGRFSLPVRAGIRNLLRRRQQTLNQTLAFGLTLMAMLVVLSVRTQLISQWQNTLPDDVPNYFVTNILPTDKPELEKWLSEREIDANKLYPMVRGRLTQINQTPIQEAVGEEARNHESLNRELNLTASHELADDNKIISGTWWSHTSEIKVPGVSIEVRLANRLGIKLGDNLFFTTGYKEMSATVQSIRQVQWESFKPNFYLIFEPGSLDELPVTYMTSFYMAEENRTHLTNLVRTFPSLSIYELNALMSQVKNILSQLTIAVEFVLIFVLIAGFCIALSTLKISMNSRLLEGAITRTLGANRKMIKNSQRIEYIIMGFISGIIAVAGAELINGFSYHFIFKLDYQPTFWAWLIIPAMSSSLIGILGPYSSRQILDKSPMIVLREI
ncbi:MAG: FtsX-like permease family protein [Pseudomonadales bacterium]|nr:FtsX-like permease family protein [Pseudomonadales bacterium]